MLLLTPLQLLFTLMPAVVAIDSVVAVTVDSMHSS